MGSDYRRHEAPVSEFRWPGYLGLATAIVSVGLAVSGVVGLVLTLVLAVLGVIGAGLSTTWLQGLWGRSSILTREAAEAKVAESARATPSLDDLVAAHSGAATTRRDDRATPSLEFTSRDVGPAVGPAVQSPGPSGAMTGAAIAGAVGLHDWLNPESAAVQALEHATGDSITSAFDLHRTIAATKYKLWTDGSMVNWRGHVGEHQIADQIESWAGEGAVDMPAASNFEGADLSFFDGEYQVKFVSDFDSIVNQHGDTLIVPEDTSNIPEDALRIDFSEPFDPSILDGHDVIVAEGLTLAGAEDAWESAVGLAAGGIDAADVLDAAGDAAIPGIGVAIRVAASGYQRREALADSRLRGRATGRVARDAAYGGGGAAAGGTAGTLIGAGIDIASFGLTLGMGSVLGGMAGTALGAKAGSKAARKEDDKLIARRQDAVKSHITNYGTAFKTAQQRMQEDWSSALARADSEADRLQAIRREQVKKIAAQTRAELERLAELSDEERRQLFFVGVTEISRLAREERSPRARRQQALWLRSAEKADDMASVLTALMMLPALTGEVREWMVERSKAQAAVVVAGDMIASQIRQQAFRDRSAIVDQIHKDKDSLQSQAKAALDIPARDVEKATKELKDELTIAGRPTKGA